MGDPKPRWLMAQPYTIRRAISRTEKRLQRDLEPRDRADETARLDQLRALLRMSR